MSGPHGFSGGTMLEIFEEFWFQRFRLEYFKFREYVEDLIFKIELVIGKWMVDKRQLEVQWDWGDIWNRSLEFWSPTPSLRLKTFPSSTSSQACTILQPHNFLYFLQSVIEAIEIRYERNPLFNSRSARSLTSSNTHTRLHTATYRSFYLADLFKVLAMNQNIIHKCKISSLAFSVETWYRLAKVAWVR